MIRHGSRSFTLFSRRHTTFAFLFAEKEVSYKRLRADDRVIRLQTLNAHPMKGAEPLLSPAASAFAQRQASSLILLTSIVVGAAMLRKILAFRSFQISHETSIITEARAFLCWSPAPTALIQQALTESSLRQVSGV